MRTLKLMVPAALLVSLAIAAPSAQAGAPVVGSSVTETCTSTALLQPILTPPKCTTAAVVCPSFCSVKARLLATSLVGTAGAHLRIFEAGNMSNNDNATCGPAQSSCSAVLGPYDFPTAGFASRAACNWNIAALAVLDKVACKIKQTVIAPPT